MKTDAILNYSMKDITDQEISIEKYSSSMYNEEIFAKPAHRRSDHFLFIFQINGSSKIIVDFHEVELIGSAVICVLPGQIHYAVSAAKDTEAWLITLETPFINEHYSEIFEDYYFRYGSKNLQQPENIKLQECIELIKSVKADQKQLNFIPQVTHSLIDACIGIFASAYISNAIVTEQLNLSRLSIITKQFKRLLLKEFKTSKSTVDYALKLNLSPAYLNEAVKSTTGFTVSYWIKQIITTEAKRLLYSTDETVKEIAYSLGFEDHAYFTRYFSKAEGQAPLKFRLAYRK